MQRAVGSRVETWVVSVEQNKPSARLACFEGGSSNIIGVNPYIAGNSAFSQRSWFEKVSNNIIEVNSYIEVTVVLLSVKLKKK